MIKKLRKVLVFAKQIDGGTGTFALQLKKLEELDPKVEISYLILEKPSKRIVEKTYNFTYFQGKLFYKNFYRLKPEMLFMVYKEFKWFLDKTKNMDYEIILSIDTHVSLLASLYKLFFNRKIKLILTIHNNLSAVTERKLSKLTSLLLKLIGHYCFRSADEVIGVSSGVSEDVKKFFNLKKVTTIYYGIDAEEIKTLLKRKLAKKYLKIFKTEKIKIISVGRFDKQKDFITVIRAFAQVKNKYTNLILTLIGDGEEKQKLIKYAKRLRLNDAIFFLGWQQNIFSFLAESDIFVHSSRYEGFPYVILEALAVGIPIVSTNSPYGVKEILGNNRYGIVVPLRDSYMLAASLMRLLKSNNIYHRYQTRAKIRGKHFSESKMLTNYLRLIKT